MVPTEGGSFLWRIYHILQTVYFRCKAVVLWILNHLFDLESLYENNVADHARLAALVACPALVVGGAVGLFAGVLHKILGACGILLGIPLFIIEKPLLAQACTSLRTNYYYKACLYLMY